MAIKPHLSNSSESEDEDSDGALADENIDADWHATLNAIRARDPKIYDKSSVFYRPEHDTTPAPTKTERPMRLQDYHRRNLLEGEGDQERVATHAQEQDALRQEVLAGIHADNESDEELLVVKPGQVKAKPVQAELDTGRSRTKTRKDSCLRLWLSGRGCRRLRRDFRRLNLMTDADEDMADAFEDAYNLRFEDPDKANERLVSYSRMAAEARSARREDVTGREKSETIGEDGER